MRHPIDVYKNWQPTYAKYPRPEGKKYSIIGLAAESGELLGVLQKAIRKNEKVSRDKVVDELGDCLWYLTCVMNEFNISWSELCEFNMNKLTERNK